MKRLKIGIVGCGAIGSSLAEAILREFSRQAQLCALYDVDPEKSFKLSRRFSPARLIAVKKLSELISRSELVIESASAAASREIARKSLLAGRQVMVMSVGGIAAKIKELASLAAKHGSALYIPSGAVCGIDGLKAAGIKKIKSVVLTTYKHPRSFKGVGYIREKGINLDRISKDRVIFDGRAKDAVKFFPQNINVAGLFSIAGIGVERTRVRIIASPAVTRNIHEVVIESEAARLVTRTENLLHPDNPKTSYLAVLSAVATLKRIIDPVKIGT